MNALRLLSWFLGFFFIVLDAQVLSTVFAEGAYPGEALLRHLVVSAIAAALLLAVLPLLHRELPRLFG